MWEDYLKIHAKTKKRKKKDLSTLLYVGNPAPIKGKPQEWKVKRKWRCKVKHQQLIQQLWLNMNSPDMSKTNVGRFGSWTPQDLTLNEFVKQSISFDSGEKLGPISVNIWRNPFSEEKSQGRVSDMQTYKMKVTDSFKSWRLEKQSKVKSKWGSLPQSKWCFKIPRPWLMKGKDHRPWGKLAPVKINHETPDWQVIHIEFMA